MSHLTPERWRAMEQILLDAWDALPEKRDALLEERCAADPELLRQLRELLAASAAADSWKHDDPVEETPQSPPRIGPFELEHLIGRGGMGAVYLAHRVDGHFEQKVAVKLVGLPLETESFRERFRQERQILATLEHPNITRLLDGGVTASGELYLAMEYVNGTGIDRYCSQPGRTVAVRLRLFRQVCAAIQCAHQNLIVHCDIKPSNILVTQDGVAKVLDFGTAKLLTSPEFTQSGLGMITASYSSPEQLRCRPVSTLTDVYSLGVILFELLTGRKLFTTDLAARLASHAPPSMPTSMAADLRRILNKALATDPSERYSSVEQFSEDIRRYLEGEPILAHPPSVVYRTGKYLSRHRWGAMLAFLSVVTLAGAALFSHWQAQIARREADRAQKIAQFSRMTLLSTVPAWYSPMRGHSGEITFKDLLENAGLRATQDLASDPASEASIRTTLGAAWTNLGNTNQSLVELRRALDLEDLVKDQPMDNQRAMTLELLCNNASGQGDYKQAREYCRESLASLRKAAHPDPDMASAILHDLAYMSDKDDAPLEEVERLYRESAAAARRYGPNDIRYLIVMNRVAACRYDAGDLQEAESILEPIVNRLRRMPGPPVDLIPPLRTLGLVRRTQGRLRDAEALFAEALGLLHKRPAGYFSADLIELNILLLQALSGKAPAVVPRARQLLQNETQGLPSGHVDRVQPELLAGTILVLAHGNAEADVLLRDAASICRDKLSHRPEREAEALSVLAQSLLEQDKMTEAASVNDRALHLFQQAFGARAGSHPLFLAVQSRRSSLGLAK